MNRKYFKFKNTLSVAITFLVISNCFATPNNQGAIENKNLGNVSQNNMEVKVEKNLNRKERFVFKILKKRIRKKRKNNLRLLSHLAIILSLTPVLSIFGALLGVITLIKLKKSKEPPEEIERIRKTSWKAIVFFLAQLILLMYFIYFF